MSAAPAVKWNPGAPPKRGAYRVKSDGPSSNLGYRYWSGDRWGPLCSRRKWANADSTHRKTPLTYPVLWASKADPLPDPCQRLKELLGLAREHLQHHNNEYQHRTPQSLFDAIEKEIGKMP